ncbi:MAG: hypothetical protein AB7V60_04410 [Candidatus Caldatribacteriota bacterium]
MYKFRFPTSLLAKTVNRLVYTDEKELQVENIEEFKKVMAALIKKNIPYTIYDENENCISVEEIISNREFWKYYFAKNISHNEAEKILSS